MNRNIDIRYYEFFSLSIVQRFINCHCPSKKIFNNFFCISLSGAPQNDYQYTGFSSIKHLMIAQKIPKSFSKGFYYAVYR